MVSEEHVQNAPAAMPESRLLSSEDAAELVRGVLEQGVDCRIQVKGSSMTPFVRDGDVVTLAPASICPPRFGDVVACIHPVSGRLVVHRVVVRIHNKVFVRGDNRVCGEPPIAEDAVLGVVRRVERRGRLVRLGLGPERNLIAWLSRTGLLARIVFPVLRILRRMLRR